MYVVIAISESVDIEHSHDSWPNVKSSIHSYSFESKTKIERTIKTEKQFKAAAEKLPMLHVLESVIGAFKEGKTAWKITSIEVDHLMDMDKVKSKAVKEKNAEWKAKYGYPYYK